MLKLLNYKILVLLMMFTLCSASAEAEFKTVGEYATEVRQLFKKGEWNKGKILLDEAIKKWGTHTNINELMGWYYYHYKKYDRSRYYLIRSLRDDPSTLHSRDILINVEEETGNYSSALCYLNEQLQYKPYFKNYWRHKILLYRKLNNDEEANRCLKRMRQIFPNDAQVQKDVSYQAETDYYYYKKNNNIPGQIKALTDLIQLDSKNPSWYIALTNVYLRQGRINDAEQISSQGLSVTGSDELLKKRVGIFTEQGQSAAAVSFLKNYAREHRSAMANGLLKRLQTDIAENSTLYDAYIQYGKVYAETKSQEALDFLLNTSISRGYYDDALYYLSEQKKRKGETKEILYKEYIMNLRLGDKVSANRILYKMYNIDPTDKDIRESVINLRYTKAVEDMGNNDYADAMPMLEFVKDYTEDQSLKLDAYHRLYNCYLELKDYRKASTLLELLKTKMTDTRYVMLYSSLLNVQGKKMEALDILYDAYVKTDSIQNKTLLSGTYEEIAVPYIKALMGRGMLQNAYNVAKKAVVICPKSVDLLTQAINCSGSLKEREDYRNFVDIAIKNYPEDPYFIVKKAGIYALDKDYDKAVNELRPYLEDYLVDSIMINAYSENSELLTLQLLKQKNKDRALAVVDSALIYNANSNSLLYTKGLVFEQMHVADSAYVYQKKYKPTLMDFQEFKHHLEELQYRGLNNELSFEYQQFRTGEADRINSNAILEYTHKYKKNEYTLSLNYAGRDGSTSEYLTNDEQESGGQGIQIGAKWQHQLNSRWTFSIGGAWANKFMPQWTVRASAVWDFASDWNLDIHASWRKVLSCSKIYAWIPNTDDYSWQYNNGGDTTYVRSLAGWNRTRVNLFQAGATVSRTLGQFVLTGTADAFILKNKFFINGVLKAQFFPVEGNRGHVFASGGAGTAPELSIIDRSLPSSFSNLNTFVSAGGFYSFNKCLAASLSGSWYTMFKQSESVNAIYLDQVDVSTSYSNLFFINAKVYLYF